MNIIDIGIIVFILFGAIIGFKRGFTKELVKCLGFILVVVLAFIFKNKLSILFYENLPFFSIGILKGASIINIIVYEFLAFAFLLIVLSLLLKVLLMATTIFEKILNATIILGIPSKIAGAIVGIIEYSMFIFIVLYIVSFPIFSVQKYVKKSEIATKLLNDTPLLSKFADKTLDVFNEFVQIKDNYENDGIPANEFNRETIEIFLKYKVVTVESLEKLIEKDKIKKVDYIDELLDKYRGEQND